MASKGPILVAVRSDADRRERFLQVFGVLDGSTVGVLEEELLEAEQHAARVLLDLAGVRHADSAAVELLSWARRRAAANGHSLVIERWSSALEQLDDRTRQATTRRFERLGSAAPSTKPPWATSSSR